MRTKLALFWVVILALTSSASFAAQKKCEMPLRGRYVNSAMAIRLLFRQAMAVSGSLLALMMRNCVTVFVLVIMVCILP
jgi:hypothetical protein